MASKKRYMRRHHNPYIYTPGYRGWIVKPKTRRQGLKAIYKGLKAIKHGLKGLIKRGWKGLSIVILDGLEARRHIVKAICRQIDKPFIHNMGISPVHKRKGLSNLQNPTGYKDIPNTSSNIQTISSGYKGLVNMLNKRFEGLEIKV